MKTGIPRSLIGLSTLRMGLSDNYKFLDLQPFQVLRQVRIKMGKIRGIYSCGIGNRGTFQGTHIRGVSNSRGEISSHQVMNDQRFSNSTEYNPGQSLQCLKYLNQYFHIPGCYMNVLVSLNHEAYIVVAYGRQ